jgi:cytochrome b involved in lipid metabolism
MRKSAVFILIFTIIVLAGFYFYNNKSSQNNSSQDKVSSNSFTSVNSNIKMTKAEISLHNKKNDCYLIIKNKVYDVSKYISNHPGGQGEIISKCGREVTGVFADIHSNFAWDLLNNYQIGQL